MNETITLEIISQMPSILLDITMDKGTYNSLLSKELVNEIYYTNLKKEIFRYFDKLNDSKTYYTLGMYSSSSFGFNSEIKTSFPISRVEKYVENKAKYEAFTNTFYLKLKNLSQILTYEEAIYLTETFFSKNTEERISEKLDISKAKLQVIKKSYLVKFYLNIIVGE